MTVTASPRSGHVAAGYESLREVLRTGFNNVGGAGFAAYLNGEQIVNLAIGEARAGTPWTVDTPAVVASATKGLAGLCIQLLVDGGELDIHQKVSHYWPEFAANGKGETKVTDILLHTAGLLGWATSGDDLGWDGSGWGDLDLIATRLAAAPPSWKPGTRHGYHAISYGWLTGELVRRITGRSLGTYFHDEFAVPMGLGLAIGAKPEHLERVAAVYDQNIADAPAPLKPVLSLMSKKMRLPTTELGLAFAADGTHSIMDKVATVSAAKLWLEAEVPASNGICSASDLATVFSMLAQGGEVDGKRYLSEGIAARWALPVFRATDSVLTNALGPLGKIVGPAFTISRTYAYMGNWPPKKPHFGPTPSSFGSEGAGGQFVFADPIRGVSVGFVRNGMSMNNDLYHALVKRLYQCLPA